MKSWDVIIVGAGLIGLSLAISLRRQGLRTLEIRGLVYDLLTGEWRLGRDLGVNYLVFAARPAG